MWEYIIVAVLIVSAFGVGFFVGKKHGIRAEQAGIDLKGKW